MALIYRIKAGKEPDMAAFNRILQELVSGGAERIVLGCTEISILNLKENVRVPYRIQTVWNCWRRRRWQRAADKSLRNEENAKNP